MNSGRPTPKSNWRSWPRKYHRWGSLLIALPFLVILATGLLLQLKKQWSWVQPPTARGRGDIPAVTLEAILESVKKVPEAGVRGWADVSRMDLQPARGIVKVQMHNRWEVQVDLQTAEVLQVAYRRSDLIESLHDGSWFHNRVKLWLFLPTGALVLGMWLTGIYLFIRPFVVLRRRRRSTVRTP